MSLPSRGEVPLFDSDGSELFDYRDVLDTIDRVGHGSHQEECCPLVVDPTLFMAVLFMIAIGHLCLDNYIMRNSGPLQLVPSGKRRRRRGLIKLDSPKNRMGDIFLHGEFV